MEAPVVFQKVESRGLRQNLQHLADRKAQLGIAVEGLTVKPNGTGGADIRGLVKLSDSLLHIVINPHLSRTVGRPIAQFTDLLAMKRSKGGSYSGNDASKTLSRLPGHAPPMNRTVSVYSVTYISVTAAISRSEAYWSSVRCPISVV